MVGTQLRPVAMLRHALVMVGDQPLLLVLVGKVLQPLMLLLMLLLHLLVPARARLLPLVLVGTKLQVVVVVLECMGRLVLVERRMLHLRPIWHTAFWPILALSLRPTH
jgi:hypothetical protein